MRLIMNTITIMKSDDVIGELFTENNSNVYDTILSIDGEEICREILFKSELDLFFEIIDSNLPYKLGSNLDETKLHNTITTCMVDIKRIVAIQEHYKSNIVVSKFKTLLRAIIREDIDSLTFIVK